MRRVLWLVMILCVLPIAVLAQSLPPANPAGAVGDIITGGSSTAAVLVNRLSERFRGAGYQGNLIVDITGTDAAFERFCRGELDIVNADRRITPQEEETCRAAGREPLAFPMGNDAMVVAVSTQNVFLADIATPELNLIFVTGLNWTDVRQGYPAEPINRFIPAPSTEEFNFVVRAAFNNDARALQTGIGTQALTDFNVMLSNVQGNPNAVGIFPASIATRNPQAVRVVPINGITPNAETAANNSYPLTRPLILYTSAAILQEQQQVAEFMNYALTNIGAELVTLGFYPASGADQVAARTNWLNASSGSSSSPSPTGETLTGIYCATRTALITINGATPPAPPAGCTCVKAYGQHTSTGSPDLVNGGVDEAQIDSVTNNAQSCPVGVTTYPWAQGAYGAGVFQPNPNSNNTSPDPASTEEPGAESTAEAASATDETLALLLLIEARSDLELLASALLGTERPTGWSGSLDVADPQLALLIRLDLELLAGNILGAEVRPDEWFGAVGSTPYAVARDIRHDLEVLADETLGEERPETWHGVDNPLLLCSRATQTLVNILQRGGVFTLSVTPDDPDFCRKAEVEAVRFTDLNLLSNPSEEPLFSLSAASGIAGAMSIDTPFAVAFLDRGAALSVGVVPEGTPITPVARSTSTFSRMTLVQGDGFLVFVDYNDTTLTEDAFENLPNSDEYPTAPFCSADWCGG